MSCKPDRRFEVIQVPDDHWMIFDRTNGRPAERDGCVFIGLDRQTALSIACYLEGTKNALEGLSATEDPRAGADRLS